MATKNHTAKTISTLITQIATYYQIHELEAGDEVFDAIDILWAPEDRPDTTATQDQIDAIREYVDVQYRTNRTRL